MLFCFIVSDLTLILLRHISVNVVHRVTIAVHALGMTILDRSLRYSHIVTLKYDHRNSDIQSDDDVEEKYLFVTPNDRI